MINRIINNFLEKISCDWIPQETQVNTLKQLDNYSKLHGFEISTKFHMAFIEAVNNKLDLTSDRYQHILDIAYSERVKLNYLMKCTIRRVLDCADEEAYLSFLRDHKIETIGLKNAFSPVSEKRMADSLRNIIENDLKYIDTLNSIFSRYCFNLFSKKCTSSFFSGESLYHEDYFELLNNKYPDLCKREFTLAYIDITEELFDIDYKDGCNRVFETINQVFQDLDNHGYMMVHIPNLLLNGTDIQWQLYADIILFSEKLKKETIDRSYFRWSKIQEITKEYIPNLDLTQAEFLYAFQGFVFKDCFVLSQNGCASNYSLLLILEKNVRDERPINCPACRSMNVQGNSYPILNVRSWECENPLCPERSKYNRGKRFAFVSSMRQWQMINEKNRISEDSIAKWHLDCLEIQEEAEIFEMALRHYSCVNDGIRVYTLNENSHIFNKSFDRNMRLCSIPYSRSDSLDAFMNCAFFKRYICEKAPTAKTNDYVTIGKAVIHKGDSFAILGQMDNECFDGAVTSPPYYNAKSYSQWPNIYCYLYDMYNISREVFRTLKYGAVYLFNIFDYFDNEKSIAFSAMGNKRMILGAYLINIFERIGFTICGNIVWDKKEIQGNRSFNQGNMTPYYQAPLNCWEHIIVLSKGQPADKYRTLTSQIEHIHPVIKMVRGKNILGHDAPYPREIPELLINCMKKEDIVLDPFLGSGTTCIVANDHSVNSVGIEVSDEYYLLSQRLIKNAHINEQTEDCYITEQLSLR